jgi:hypothetical protein
LLFAHPVISAHSVRAFQRGSPVPTSAEASGEKRQFQIRRDL